MLMLMRIILVLVVAVIVTLPVGHVHSQDLNESGAEQTLLHYFDALSLGDTRTLKSLMGGSLLEKRTRLLNNPAYPQYLAETFGVAIFTIDRIVSVSPDIVGIDATMKFGKDDYIQRRFLLHRVSSASSNKNTYLVHDEIEPP
jgi:hypothetical protein